MVVLAAVVVGGYFGLRAGESAAESKPTAAVELDGIGAETIGRRAASRGWMLSSDPILNLEGTHQTQTVTLAKGSQRAVVSIYAFVDASNAERRAAELERDGVAERGDLRRSHRSPSADRAHHARLISCRCG